MVNKDTFWQDYTLTDDSLNQIFNYLLESETPATQQELAKIIVQKEIDAQVKKTEEIQKSEGAIYYPKNLYKPSDHIVFPHLNWAKAVVKNVRDGLNPEYPDLQVIEVAFEDSSTASFASNLLVHKLNEPVQRTVETWLNPELVHSQFGSAISEKIKQELDASEDLVCIAGHYFPRALLVDIGIGQLNLCEAILELENGGPLTIEELIKQIDIPSGVNPKLTEFSLDYALQEDPRFDEVGPAGTTLWFLNRLEPTEVQNTPTHLIYDAPLPVLAEEYRELTSFGSEQCDEYELETIAGPVETVTISLTYPHWRSGTLPLTSKLKLLFPTAYETPRVKFNFLDEKNDATIPGWVVRPSKYIYGLRDWYAREGVIPGSLLQLSRGKNPGEVLIKVEKPKNSKEWIRTVLVGADGGVVIALLKQVVTCAFDDRMALVAPDPNALDGVWEKKLKLPIEKVVNQVMTELSKLNPQGQIHAQELYAAINVIRRCPPSVVLNVLYSEPWVKHLGDLYFKLVD
jgi:hypothetical protein